MKTLSFYGRGKLLLSGEYFVLDGAEGLALPTKMGQSMAVNFGEESKRPLLHWNSLDCQGNCWLQAKFEFQQLDLVDTPLKPEVLFLQKLLRQSRRQNESLLRSKQNIRIETRLEFSRQWGLGSSSTLISLVAKWAKICPLELAFNTTAGSGYDIACAQSDGPIIYSRPHWKTITFAPPFKDCLYIVPLEKKCSSPRSVEYYKRLSPFPAKIIEEASRLTKSLLAATDLQKFQQILSACESFVAKHLRLTPIQTRLFPDFDGTIKSLGSWGGDCILAASALPRKDIVKYFTSRGYPHCIPWREMVCSP